MENICKKLVVGVLFVSLFGVGMTFADLASWPVGSYGSTTLKSVFGWDDRPWVYLPIPYANVPSEHIDSTWIAPSGSAYSIVYDSYVGDRWLGDYLPGGWTGVREVGNWTVNTTWCYNYYTVGDGPHNYTSTGFTVTPEPVSALLFAAGGLFLARRRK